jgi:rubrerythrin
MAQFTQQDIRTTLQLIINEEKGHAEHLTELVLKYDRDKYNSLD